MSKKKIAFITDSTAYLTEELRNHPDVYEIPMVIISENKEYEDGVDLSSNQLYQLIRDSKDVPKTSQPSIGKFQELYENLQKNYDHAIAIHISNKLSGTIRSSETAKEEVNFDVEVVDSLSLSYAITRLLYKGIELVDKGLGVKEVADKLREEVANSRNLILLGNLDQLYKGGRMSGAQFLLGNFLQIKPILTINSEGELVLHERIRSEKKATNKVVELIKQSSEENMVNQVEIMHGNCVEKANALKNKLEEAIPGVSIVLGELSSSLAVHAGEGTLALFWHLER